MDYKVRLGATLEFDSAKELDLIKNVKDLTERHKLGAYINALLRYAWEHPEKFKGTEVCPLANGLEPKRDAYFNNIDKELLSCKKAIDEMYKEMLQLYTAAKVGATFGLVENTSEFIFGLQCIEEYIKKIRNKLNLGTWSEGIYEIEKKQNPEEVANAAADILIKMMVSKNVDLRINSSGVSTPVQPVASNNQFVNTQNSAPGTIVKGNTPVETVDTKSDEQNTEDDTNLDLVASFCNM